MKIKVLCLLIFTLFISHIGIAQNAAQTEKTISDSKTKIALITIEGMACQEGCADAIDANLNKSEGVESAATSFETGKATVKFNPDQITIDTIKSVITNTKVKDYSYTIKEVSLKNILK